MANWDYLLEGMLIEIAKRVHSYDDFESIHRVNHHWRSALKGIHYPCNTTTQVPWLMLVENLTNHHQVVEERGFYSLTKDRVRHIKLPELPRRVRVLSSRGWLLIVTPYKSVSLLNPFSRRVILLPDLCPRKDHYEETRWRFWIERFVLSLSPSSNDEDYTVMVTFGSYRALAVWRPGDSEWTMLASRFFSDVIYFGGLFYGIRNNYQVEALKVEHFWDETLHAKRYRMVGHCIADMSVPFSKATSSKIYLVCSQGKLLAITRESDWGRGYTSRIWLAELNLLTGEVVALEDLGDKSLFLGSNESMSLEGIEGCEPNCIFFTDDDFCSWPWHGPGGQNMGIYKVIDGSFEPFYSGESLSHINPPLWIEYRA